MENNLSQSLNEISEKLTTISEEVKKLQKEDKPISTGKTYSYRRAILWTAFSIALTVGLYVDYCVPSLNSSFMLLAVYTSFSLAGETIIYRWMKKKDSMKTNTESVQEKYSMTLNDLDIYIKKLASIRILAVIITLTSLGFAYGVHALPVYIFWIIYLVTTFASMLYIRMRGKIKVPKRFFLFDLPKGQGGELPHRPYEYQSIADHAFGGSWERYREHLYSKD